MNTNFNLVKKPKKEDEEIDEEEDIELDEDDDSSKKSSNSSDMKRRMLLIMGVIVAGTIILLLVLYIASLFMNHEYSYDDMEEVMKEAAISYFQDYPEYLPKNNGDIVQVDVANLVAAEKMKDLSTYRSDEVACTGNVQVENVDGEYLYIPYLNCGDAYNTISFGEKILADNPTTTSGDGLYSNGGSSVFRGESIHNYVKLDNSLWRIVKVNSDKSIVLIHATGLEYYKPWDDRYNEEKLYESGINTYNVSRMKDYLQKIYAKPDKDEGEDILSDSDKGKITSYDLCAGKRSADSETKNNREECSQKVKDQKLGLLTLSDYLYASLDSTCKSANTKSCTNYNYLVMDDEWWLLTANTEDTSTVYKVDRNGIVKADIASTYSKVRPVITLNSRTMYANGKGTESDPYEIK